eukprot:TRINITY_DN2364_c0_g2_i2.p1 TRINITY_DN2364_c0_g2~~TRINITY_DN2364_c0_g2_i2.p1  ORF type:complete len:498 (+),score=66.65 TRINITY_DN2364_c0_g2_i2:23-1495(+)
MTQRLPSTKEEARSGWRNYCKDPSSITQIMKGDLGFGPNTVVSDNGNTALQVTIIYSSHEATKILFNYGADPNKMNNSGRSAVCLAISTNRSTPTADNYNKVVTMLRKATEETLKAVVQTYLSTSINDPIMECQLVVNGNPVDYKSTLSTAPVAVSTAPVAVIYLCVRACNIKGVRTLLQWGANPATPQLSSGSNCLHCSTAPVAVSTSCYYGYLGFISLLCRLPCAGEMAAHANARGDLPIIDLLLASKRSMRSKQFNESEIKKRLYVLLSLHIPTLIAGDARSYRLVKKLHNQSDLILSSISGDHELTQRVLKLFDDFSNQPVFSLPESPFFVSSPTVSIQSSDTNSPTVADTPTDSVSELTAPVAVPAAPVAVSTAPVAVSTAPVAVSTAPVAVSTAPVAVSTAPVAVKKKKKMTQRLPSTKEEARSGWRNYCKDPSSITQIMKGDLGFGPNTVVSDNGNTALQVTIIYSSHEATKILFNYGADPNK